jgi:hypothetical protein
MNLQSARAALASERADEVPLAFDAWGAAALAQTQMTGVAKHAIAAHHFADRMSRAGRFDFEVGLASFVFTSSSLMDRPTAERGIAVEAFDDAIGLEASSEVQALLSTDVLLRLDYRSCLQVRASQLWRAASDHPQSSVPELERALRLANEANEMRAEGNVERTPIFDVVAVLMLLGRLDEADGQIANAGRELWAPLRTLLRADLLLRRGRNEDAAALFREIVADAEVGRDAKSGLAVALARGGDLAGARAVLKEIRSDGSPPWLPWLSRDEVEKEIARLAR